MPPVQTCETHHLHQIQWLLLPGAPLQGGLQPHRQRWPPCCGTSQPAPVGPHLPQTAPALQVPHLHPLCGRLLRPRIATSNISAWQQSVGHLLQKSAAMASQLVVLVCIGEAAIRWEASQASGLKMDLEAQLEDAGLPKIAIEVRQSAVQGLVGRYARAVGPAQQQLSKGSVAACGAH
jgi:hypothetical protein